MTHHDTNTHGLRLAPETKTHCPYCALQCGITLVPAATARDDAPTPGALALDARDFPTSALRVRQATRHRQR